MKTGDEFIYVLHYCVSTDGILESEMVWVQFACLRSRRLEFGKEKMLEIATTILYSSRDYLISLL
jgi:hypothetical protein